jgi:hypothetical protein
VLYILAFLILTMDEKLHKIEEKLFTMLFLFTNEVQFHVALICAVSLLQTIQAVAIIGILLQPKSDILKMAISIAIVKL